MRRSHRQAGQLAAVVVSALACTILALPQARAADRGERPLTVSRPAALSHDPVVPSQILPGAPIPWSGSPLLTPPDLSIVDGQTRFLASGPAQDRCPGERIDFVIGVVNAYRPTVPGDGAFMCHGDAIAEGFVGP